MRIRLTVGIFIIAFISSGNVYGQVVGPDIKQKFIVQIEQELAALKRGLKEELASNREAGAEVFFPPEVIRKMTLEEEKKKLKHLLKFIKKSSSEDLPSALVDLFIKEASDYSHRYPLLDSYVAVLGELSVVPLTEHYESSDIFLRERILNILGQVKSDRALPLVREALKDENPRVTMSAITALRFILDQDSKGELKALLGIKENEAVIKHILGHLGILKDPHL
jgi:HEAT repeat protein